MPGNILVPIALLSWPLIVMMLFKKRGPQQAIVISFVAGWMFLPVANYDIFLLRNTKTAAICYSIIGCAYFLDKERLLTFKFNAADLPMVLWCTAPFFSAIANGLGPYNGFSQAMYQSVSWGMPYYIARVYFSDVDSLKMLALGIFIGSIVYIPFCWFELIMSPQLHRLTYGYHQSDFLQTLRDGGGFRPMVYMDHGLMTSMWMVLGVFLGVWLLLCDVLPKKIMQFPSLYLLFMLIFTTVMMRSAGAISLLIIGLIVLLVSNKTKNGFLLLVLLIVPHLYIVTRTTGYWDGRNLSDYVSQKFSVTRSQSLQFRFDNEYILIDKALQGTFFGWGGYGRSRVYDDKGKDISVTDGLWIITFGQNGTYGLAMMVIAIQWPVLLFWWRVKSGEWNSQAWATSAVMAVFLSIYMIDNLLNSMINPIYMLFSGGLIGLILQPSEVVARESEIITVQPDEKQGKKRVATRFIPSPTVEPSRFIQ